MMKSKFKIIIIIIVAFLPKLVFSQNTDNSYINNKKILYKNHNKYDYNLYLKEKNPFFKILGFKRIATLNKLKVYNIKKESSKNITSADFTIEDCKLLKFTCYNKNGDSINIGEFINGNGKIILQYNKYTNVEANFKNGILNDTVFYYDLSNDNKFLQLLMVFKDGILNGEYSVYNNKSPFINHTFIFENGEVNHIFQYGFYNYWGTLPILKYFIKSFHDLDKVNLEIIYESNGSYKHTTYNIDGSIKKEIIRKRR